ncbi:hypothetical protein F0919_01105 [Taibaiella lutea]|uniref:Gliding motility-associated protein GldM second immunoglobulin-like domain-containing protein n=1 Tax=Taibaiella lutea TaxID=2608001 RepID=A0A5M6CTF5_9BACT|nr:GldM family protein [Taibaiella lutea]KAA5536295.1 hypothetical protein F0919_01105 [Taibaiella lutea]
MKILLLLLFSLYLPISMSGQNVVVANDGMNVAYAGVPNPITIAVENYKAEQVIVSTDNGTLVNNGDGNYYYTPLKAGEAIIKLEVKTKNGNREIGQTGYRIKEAPAPTASIGRETGGQISRAKLIPQLGILATMQNLDIEMSSKFQNLK